MLGSTIPFPPTAARRRSAGDPRASIEERYAGRDDYLQHVRNVADVLVADRALLAEDVDLIMQTASRSWDLFTAS
jgi:hypothetical protein